MPRVGLPLIFIFFFFTVIPCSSDIPTKTPVSLSFWTPLTGSEGGFFDAAVVEFNKGPKEVLLQNKEVKTSGYYEELINASKYGSAPDLVIVNQSRLADLVSGNALLPLDEYIDKAGIDLSDYEEGLLDSCRVKGKLYAIPFDVQPLIMYYNKDLFAKAGISKAPETLAELQETARVIQAKTGAIGIATDTTARTYKAYTLARLFISFLMEQGRTTLDSRNARANFNNAEGIKAYQAIFDMVNNWKVMPEEQDYELSVKYFREGKAAIHFNGVWAIGLFEGRKDLNFGAVELPPFFGKSAAWSSSHAFAIPRTNKSDDKKIMQTIACMDWFTTHAGLWAKSGNIPTRKTVRITAEYLALPHRAEYAAAAEDSFAPPLTAKWPACYITIADELSLALNRKLDAKTALGIMEKKVNAILKTPLPH